MLSDHSKVGDVLQLIIDYFILSCDECSVVFYPREDDALCLKEIFYLRGCCQLYQKMLIFHPMRSDD